MAAGRAAGAAVPAVLPAAAPSPGVQVRGADCSPGGPGPPVGPGGTRRPGGAHRARLFRSITNADWLFLARSRASDFTHALTTELSRVGLATTQLLTLIVNCAVAGVYVLFTLQTSPTISGFVLLSGALLFAVLRR